MLFPVVHSETHTNGSCEVILQGLAGPPDLQATAGPAGFFLCILNTNFPGLLSVFQPALHCHVFPQEFILVIPLLLICPLSVFIQSCVK